MSSAGYFRKARKGGAAVELAILFPVILLLLIGIVDYGRVFYTWVTVSNAARAGAEYGGQNQGYQQDTANMRLVAQADGNEAGTLTLTPTWFCECAGAGAGCGGFCPGGAAPEVYVKVIASKSVNMFFAFPGLPSTVTISRTAIFRSQ